MRLGQSFVPYSLRHENIGLAEAIGIRDGTHNHIAQFLVEAEHMPSEVAHVGQLS